MTAPYRKKQNDEKLDGWSDVRQGGLADQDQTVHAKNTHKQITNLLILLSIDTKTSSPSGGRPFNKQLCRKSVKG